MKHSYKSMLFAAMAITTWSASYLAGHFTASPFRDKAKEKEVALQKDMAGLSPKTVEDIKTIIARQEYHISYDEQKKALQSPNRTQNLRAYYKPGELTVKNRVDSAGHNFQLHLVNEGIYADGKKLYAAQPDAKTENTDNKLLIKHEGFTEEFINNEDGIRQNFIIENAPAETKTLQVRLSAKGLKARNGNSNEVHFYDEKTENDVVYSDLHVWDANKQPLAATLAYVNNHVEINVSAEGAAYPVTIDPIVANGNPNNPDKIVELDHSNAWLGFSVSSAGDVNGDGYSDIIVGAPLYDWNGVDAGVAYVFPGTTAGLSLAGQRLNRNQAFAQMGYSVASAGDVNKDGYSDVIVGAPYWDDVQNNEGAAFLYYGGPVSAAAPIGINPGNFLTFQSDQPDAAFGISVAMAGDVNADGFSDFMVGAHLYDKDQVNEGVAFLYYGANGGIDQSKTEILERNQADAMFGYAIAGAGDVNADGASDILVGARFYDINQNKSNEGAVFVYLGSINSTPVTQAQPQIIQATQADARLGHTVSTAGDINGDGFADIAIGAYMFDGGLSNEGVVYIHHGGVNGVTPNPSKTLEGDQLEAQFGWSIASAGDVNGDGYGDLLIGSRFYDNGQANEGAVFVYHGSDIGLKTTYASMIESNQGDGWLGSAVASAGDVNGDGYSDIVIGCYTYDHGQNDEGQVFVYHGSAETIGSIPRNVSGAAKSGALAGSSVSSAGDINGDGLDDVIVGAPNYDDGNVGEGAAFISYGDAINGTNSQIIFKTDENNAHVGCSVSGAGDVNGDGYDDVIIGASGAQNGLGAKGAAYIFHGGAQGLVSAVSKTLFSGNQGFGTSVSDAGDINRDGYDDVIVGMPTYSKANANLCGAVLIYLGSNGGIPSSGTVVTSNQAGAQMGNSLDNAGDVNGDGYSDIIVGASMANFGKNKEGAAFIWYGTSAGIPNNALYSNTLLLNQAEAEMGTSVAGAGDVNGDGFSDVIVGSPKFDQGQSDEGIASIFYGSGGGCASVNRSTLEVNQGDAHFGTSVGGGMDVNGDGYDDVVIGAPDHDLASANGGGIWVFHGTRTGINTTSSFATGGAQANSHMGQAVSSAGDLNGDGYGDILVGMPNYDQSGITDGGVAWAYFGNNGYVGKNKRNNIRLYNSNLTTLMNFSQSTINSAGVALYPTSFLGRNDGRLLWGWAQHGTSFAKVPNYPITNSTASNGQGPYYALSGIPIANLITKSWPATRIRVRIKYELNKALTGQVYSPWRHVPEYLIFNQGITPPVLAGDEMETAIFQDAKPEYKDVVSVYPNPVSDRLFIQSTNMDQVKSLQLVSTNGTMAFTSAQPQTEVDVKHLPTGSYILTINRKDGSKSSHKVMIRR